MATVIIARKIGLMVAFFAFEGQESWLLAILVIVIALMAHVAFRPFEAPLTDMTEMFSLVANLVLLVSVPVYAVLQDSADTERAVRIVWFLEGLAVSLILAVCIVAGYAQLHIFRVVAHDDQADDGDSNDAAELGGLEMKDDESRAGYKQRMLNKRLEQARAEVTLLERSVASYRTYQEHELDEVCLCCARVGLSHELNELSDGCARRGLQMTRT